MLVERSETFSLLSFLLLSIVEITSFDLLDIQWYRMMIFLVIDVMFFSNPALNVLYVIMNLQYPISENFSERV